MNVTALVNTSGTVVERYLYDPYGKVTIYDDDWSDTVAWANSKKNEILYCGYRWDPETGLYHVRRRFYHPTLGRWPTRDSAAEENNLFEYVASDPILFIDEYGLWKQKLGAQSVYEAEAGDYSLDGLLQKVAKGWTPSPGWQYCLWAVCMSNPDNYPRVSPGDQFDASYFTEDSSKEFKGAIPKAHEPDTDYTYAAAAFYGATIYSTSQDLAIAVRDASGQGKTPLKRTVFIGHGGSGESRISGQFGPEDLDRAGTWIPSYKDSKNRIGPKECWFAWNGEIRLVTCYGATRGPKGEWSQMDEWASTLSPQATVYGTVSLAHATFLRPKQKNDMGPQMQLRLEKGGRRVHPNVAKFEKDTEAWKSMKGTLQETLP